MAAALVLFLLQPCLTGTAAQEDTTLFVSSKSALMHLRSDGRLVSETSWKPMVSQWWQDWHLTVNPRNNTVCWINAEEDQSVNAILRCAKTSNLNDTWDLPQPNEFSLNGVNNIALDWVTNNWYLTETYTRVNYVCSYLFEKCARLGKSSGNVRFFATYDIPNRRMVLITNSGDGYKLEMANLDGSDRKIISEELDYPSGLAVDSEDKMVYWIDQFDGPWAKAVYRVDYEGEGKEKFVDLEEGFHVRAWRRCIDVVGKHVFLMWKDNQYIGRVNKSTKEKVNIVGGSIPGATDPRLENVTGLLTIKAFNPRQQPEGIENLCSEENGGCHEFCIPTVVNGSAAATCVCDAGLTLVESVCRKPYPATAVVARGDRLQAVDLQTNQSYDIVTDLANVTDLDFLWEGPDGNYLLFWLDDGDIYRGRWTQGATEVTEAQKVVTSETGSTVTGLAIDFNQRNLLWMEKDQSGSDYNRNMRIKLALLDGSSVKTIAEHRERNQRALTVRDAGRNFIYSEISFGVLEIAEYEMGGKSAWIGLNYPARQHMASQPVAFAHHVSISHDVTLNRFYWAEKGSIQSFAYTRTYSRIHREVLRDETTLAMPGGLDVFGERIFWTEKVSNQLYSAHADTTDDVQVVSSGKGREIHAVKIVHPWKQVLDKKQVCDGNECSHLCIRKLVDWKPTGVCVCPDGMEIADDNSSCQ